MIERIQKARGYHIAIGLPRIDNLPMDAIAVSVELRNVFWFRHVVSIPAVSLI